MADIVRVPPGPAILGEQKKGPPLRTRAVFLSAVFLLACLSAGCGILRKPDLSRTTGIASIRKPSRPLILIHGFLGSKLRDPKTHKVAWGTMANVLTGGDTDDLALPLTPDGAGAAGEDLEAFEVYGNLWGVDYYRKILRSLSQAGGYQIGDIDNPKPGDSAFVFVYDWRQDNVESARLLARAIERLKSAMGNSGERFDILAHSQGGLIARYYIKYGGAELPEGTNEPAPTMAGAASVNQVIMLGTPNQGCLEALKILHLGVKKVFRPMRPEVIFTMPAVYQMLPPRGTLVFADAEGRPVPLDLYDPQTWVREGWSVFSQEARARLRKRAKGRGEDGATAAVNAELSREFLGRQLARADLFHRALDAPTPAASDVPYFAFGSDCISTLKSAIVTTDRGRPEILFDRKRFREEKDAQRVAKILYGPGDGTVLMQSLLGIGDSEPRLPLTTDSGPVHFDSAFFVCENHGLLPNDPIFQNNLFYILLWPQDRRAPSALVQADTSF